MAHSSFKDFKTIGTPTSKADALTFAKRAEQAAAIYKQAHDVVAHDIRKLRDKVDAQLSQHFGDARKALAKVLEDQFRIDRKRLLDESDKIRYEPLRQLKSMVEVAESAAEFFNNKIGFLTA